MEMMLALAALAAVSQDASSERIERLLERLGSDSIVERDEAAEALERIGPPALPALEKAREGGGGEIRARAEAVIRAIGRERKIAGLEAESRRITARLDQAPAAEVARALGVEADASLAGRLLSLDVREAPLLEALDVLCAATEDLTYGKDQTGRLLLAKGRHVAYPAAYAGAFRLRVTRLDARRMQTFLAHKVQLELVLEADHGPSVKPLPHPHIVIEEAVDDQGTALTLVQEKPQAWVQPNRPTSSGVRFGCDNLSPLATRMSRIRAVAHFVFPLESSEAVFESPARGDVRDLGAYRAAIAAMSTDSAAGTTTLQLTFTAEGIKPEVLHRAIETRLERSSVVLVDASGQEVQGLPTVPQERRFMRPEEAPTSVDHHFVFARRLPRAERKALKLRFHADTYEKPVTFELKDVRLP